MMSYRGRNASTEERAEGGPSLLAALWRQRWLLIAAVVLAAGIGFALSSMRPDIYRAETRLFLSPTHEFSPLDTGQWGGEPERFVANRAEMAVSGSVLSGAAEQLGGDWDVETLRDQVDARPSPSLDVIEVTADAATPEGAAALADAVALAYREHVLELVAARVERAEDVADEELPDIRAHAAVYGDGVAAMEPAEIPESRASPQPVRDALILGLFAGVVVGLVAFLRHEGSAAPEAATLVGAPVLGDVDLDRPDEFDTLAVALLAQGDGLSGMVGVANPGSSDHHVAVAAGLAAAVARQHGHAALVMNRDELPASRTPYRTAEPTIDAEGLTVDGGALPTWPVGPGAVVSLAVAERHPGTGLRKALATLGQQVEFVIVSLGTPTHDAGALAASGQVDGIVVALNHDAKPEEVRALRERLELVAAPVRGVVRTRPAPGRRS